VYFLAHDHSIDVRADADRGRNARENAACAGLSVKR